MSKLINKKVLALMDSEAELVSTVDDLWQRGFDRHDVFIMQHKQQSPTFSQELRPLIRNQSPLWQDVLMPEDLGWEISVSLSIPLLLGMLLGVYLSDVYSASASRMLENSFFMGGVGLLLGSFIAYCVWRRHEKRVSQKIENGSFLLAVRATTKQKIRSALSVLHEHHAKHIKIRAL